MYAVQSEQYEHIYIYITYTYICIFRFGVCAGLHKGVYLEQVPLLGKH